MLNGFAIGRLGLLAGGLGVGAAVASTPGVASADTGMFDPSDFAVSIDGFPLFQSGTATATSGVGDVAIADGANSSATATGGLFNAAFANGTDSDALAGSDFGVPGNLDFADAVGPDINVVAGAGNFNGATVVDPAATPSSPDNVLADFGFDNSAFVFGAEDFDRAGGDTLSTGNCDIADIFGNSSQAFAGSVLAAPGSVDLAVDLGNMLDANATGANFLIDIMPMLGMLGM